jgi:hypothetical protein
MRNPRADPRSLVEKPVIWVSPISQILDVFRWQGTLVVEQK